MPKDTLTRFSDLSISASNPRSRRPTQIVQNVGGYPLGIIDELDWGAHALSFALIREIVVDKSLTMQMLPSFSLQDAPPNEGHWLLLRRLVQTLHPLCQLASTQRMAWRLKVRQRLFVMSGTVVSYEEMLGADCSDIMYEDDVERSSNNELVAKWAVIRMSCPWFFEMRRLMRLRHANVTPNDAHDTLVLRRLPLRIAAPIAEFQYELESDTPHWLPDA